MSEAQRPNWLWRSAVAAPLVKGLLCGILAAAAIAYAYSPDGYGALLGLALFIYGLGLAAVAVLYLLASFLVARRALASRIGGALLDALLTLLIAWVIFEAGLIFGHPTGELPEFVYDPRPILVAVAVAALWVAALIPAAKLLWGRRSPA